ncbi:YdeI/OmpD-associated family protein [Cryobacterium sp. BB307]|uniref:YdeI/OmpD-associated family protein n=1 Tax=Cryobacterium sp. BB307 TaxID=2716317 RepID=UPI001444FF13|nr:YdeI/OmpD-associated family protein [Cryobacterium sp. BB307]
MAIPLEDMLFPDAAAWRSWLEQNHDRSPGVRLILTKKGGTVTALDYEGALQEALCFGWIDGQSLRRDDETWFQRFTPRTKRSSWSLKNIERIERLEADGRMTDAGRAAVEAAKADGRWEAAYAGPASAELPADLLAAIAAVPEAQRMFEVLNPQNRFALYFRLSQLKTQAGRERRIAAFVDMLARHETPYPQKRMP